MYSASTIVCYRADASGDGRCSNVYKSNGVKDQYHWYVHTNGSDKHDTSIFMGVSDTLEAAKEAADQKLIEFGWTLLEEKHEVLL